MKSVPAPLVLSICFVFNSLFVSAQLPDTVMAERMLARAERFLGVPDFDSAAATGFDLLSFARQKKLPSYVAAAWSTLGVVAYHTNQAMDAVSRFDSALSVRRAYLGPDHPEVAVALSNIGSLLLDLFGDAEAALERFEEAYRICSNRPGGCAEGFSGSLYNNLGNVHAARGNYELAEHFYLRSYEIRSGYPDDPRYKLASLLNNLGSMKAETGHTGSARDYLLQSESLYLRWNKGNESPDLVQVRLNLGVVANLEYERSQAKKYLYSALRLGEKFYDNLYLEFGKIHHNLAVIYNEEDSLDAAERHYRSAIEFWETNFGFHPDQTASITGLGLIAGKRGLKAEALELYKKAEALDEANFPPQHIRRANNYHLIGTFFQNNGDHRQAYHYYRKQLQALGLAELSKDSLSKARPSQLLVTGLTNLGKLYFDRYRVNKSTAQLDSALMVFSLADSVLQKLREVRLTFGEQKQLLSDARAMAEWSIQAEIARYGKNTERAFYRSEQNRAYNLYAKFREDAAVRYSGVPDSLTSLYRNWSYEIAHADNLLQEMPADDPAYFKTRAHLAELRMKMSALKQTLAGYEKYYKFRFGTSTASLREVQQKILRPGEVMVQYFAGDSAIFVSVVSKDRYEFQVIPNDFDLKGKVDALRWGITAYFLAPKQDDTLLESTLDAYERNAQELYRRLVAPLKLRPADSLLIIVPDGVLWYVPFEALLSAAPPAHGDLKDYPYLLRKHRISYAYSATLLREAAGFRHQDFSTPLVACAPFSDAGPEGKGIKDDLFTPLIYSAGEVRAAQRLLGGDTLIGNQATKSAVVSRIPDARIVLFSTHGLAGEEGYLAFYPDTGQAKGNNLLRIGEVYNLPLHADLVIFSACETALGQQQTGEGLISLARAFTYSGTGGIVTTLWSVNESSTSAIVTALCENLAAKKTARESLSAAKQHWLNTCTSEGAHPWYWAGMIGMGVLR